jgi:hypothetical protein
MTGFPSPWAKLHLALQPVLIKVFGRWKWDAPAWIGWVLPAFVL